VTLADLPQRLDVPLADVLKAAMALGLLKLATDPLAPEDAHLVEKLIRLDRLNPVAARGHSRTVSRMR
jgi:hypothetical protein